MGMYLSLHAVRPDDLQALLDDPEAIPDLLGAARRGGASLSLEKAWHGLHYLLTGTAWENASPLGFLLQGGEPVGEDLGYGPARLFRPDAVQQLDAALAQVSDDQLWSRFDPEQMEQEQIYPGTWDEPEADLREEYVGYFQELKRLVGQARAEGQALLVLLS